MSVRIAAIVTTELAFAMPDSPEQNVKSLEPGRQDMSKEEMKILKLIQVTWGRFRQHFKRRFYVLRSQKRKKDWRLEWRFWDLYE